MTSKSMKLPSMQQVKSCLVCLQEKEKLQETIGTLKQNLVTTQETTGLKDGSMAVMKQSFAQLKERLDKKEKKIRALEKTVATLEVILFVKFS